MTTPIEPMNADMTVLFISRRMANITKDSLQTLNENEQFIREALASHLAYVKERVTEIEERGRKSEGFNTGVRFARVVLQSEIDKLTK